MQLGHWNFLDESRSPSVVKRKSDFDSLLLGSTFSFFILFFDSFFLGRLTRSKSGSSVSLSSEQSLFDSFCFLTELFLFLFGSFVCFSTVTFFLLRLSVFSSIGSSSKSRSGKLFPASFFVEMSSSESASSNCKSSSKLRTSSLTKMVGSTSENVNEIF